MKMSLKRMHKKTVYHKEAWSCVNARRGKTAMCGQTEHNRWGGPPWNMLFYNHVFTIVTSDVTCKKCELAMLASADI